MEIDTRLGKVSQREWMSMHSEVGGVGGQG